MKPLRSANTTIRNMEFLFSVLYIYLMFINYTDSDAKRSLPKHERRVGKSDRQIVILLWNQFFNGYNYMFGKGREGFEGKNGCRVRNCIVANNRKMRPIEQYDAIVFHAWQFQRNDIPPRRNPRQFYTYLSMESPDTFKINRSFDNFFNWTVSYRSDSDFFWPYYRLKDNYGDVISPSTKPNWDKYYLASNKGLVPTLSNCNAANSRHQYVRELQKFIQVDIYGKCGDLICPKEKENACYDMVKSKYFFLVSFENSHCMEYMTEKGYRALLHDTIPVVYGRVNFMNFIPPHSYLDANVMAPREMAYVMNRLANDPDEYAAYFWWKGQFTFHHASEPSMNPFCEMCKTLKRPDLKRKTQTHLVRWWETLPHSSAPACIHPKIRNRGIHIL